MAKLSGGAPAPRIFAALLDAFDYGNVYLFRVSLAELSAVIAEDDNSSIYIFCSMIGSTVYHITVEVMSLYDWSYSRTGEQKMT